MFIKYGVYRDGKMITIIGDEQLSSKPASGGRSLGDGAEEASKYSGAKPCLLINPDRWNYENG